MTEVLKANRSFFIPFLVFFSISVGIICLYSKADIHLFINSFHHSLVDQFFLIITHLGDGIMAIVFTIILFFFSKRKAIIMGTANLLASIIVSTMKATIFADIVRPARLFENVHDIYIVPGLDMHYHGSMPSGHAATAFCIFLCFALFSTSKRSGILFFLIAAITAFSRVYLSQHFLVDIIAGSLIGISCSLSAFMLVDYIDKKHKPAILQ